MNTVSTPLIRHNARCRDCGNRFTFYTFSDFEYGRRLGTTVDPQELGLLDGLHDPVIKEVAKLVDDFLKPLNKKDWQRLRCFNSVFGVACDPSPSGYQYDFTGKIRCPACSSANVSYGPESPPKVEVVDLHPVTHNDWQQLSKTEKRERIRNALQKDGCLP
jgi:hypothetical protein